MATRPAAQPPILSDVLRALETKGLHRGVDRLVPRTARPPVPSGHAALDQALVVGGWPRGALALLDAPAGVGATTLALTSSEDTRLRVDWG